MRLELSRDEILCRVRAALAEDLGRDTDWLRGDITAQACIPQNRRGRARIEARQAGVICGMDFVRCVFEEVADGCDTRLRILVEDGDSVAAQDRLVEIDAPLQVILTAERTALNFLQHLSGIATATHKVVELAPAGLRILDTRKTLPGWRALAKYAVRCGGGTNHRHGLFDMFLIKENHIRAAGGIPQAIVAAREFRDTMALTAKIEVEVESLHELQLAVDAGAEIAMLDNFTPDLVPEAVALAAGRIKLEVSGGITAATLISYAKAGVDFISLGAITHSAPAFDLSLLVEEVEL